MNLADSFDACLWARVQQNSAACAGHCRGAGAKHYGCCSPLTNNPLSKIRDGLNQFQVTVESSASAPNFVVGVCHKPLTNCNLETSEEIWAISHRGSIFHAGESDDCMSITLATGGSLELQYSACSADGGTLFCDYGTGYMVVHGISRSGKPVYPVLLFPQDNPVESNLVKVRFHPIIHSCFTSLSDFRHREQLASGYPHLSPTSTTLSQAIVGLIHQLQDKEPWNSSITQVGVLLRILCTRILYRGGWSRVICAESALLPMQK